MRAMRNLRHTLQRMGCLIPVLLLSMIAIGGVFYLISTITTERAGPSTIPLSVQTVAPPLPGTPVARFFQVNASIIDNYYSAQPNYGAVSIDALAPQLQPIGAYLPQTGNTAFELIAPTPLPTPLPYPTSPPLPLPALPDSPVPTVPALNEDGTPRIIPYVPGEEDCAPAGNPVDGILTQRFHLYHSGIDIGIGLGTPVIATHSGQVTFADWSDVGYGYLVIVQSGVFITYYAHNTSFNVTTGQFVGKGSIIAWSGSTGNSSGPHVHYETRINDVPVDPLTFEGRGYASC